MLHGLLTYFNVLVAERIGSGFGNMVGYCWWGGGGIGAPSVYGGVTLLFCFPHDWRCGVCCLAGFLFFFRMLRREIEGPLFSVSLTEEDMHSRVQYVAAAVSPFDRVVLRVV